MKKTMLLITATAALSTLSLTALADVEPMSVDNTAGNHDSWMLITPAAGAGGSQVCTPTDVKPYGLGITKAGSHTIIPFPVSKVQSYCPTKCTITLFYDKWDSTNPTADYCDLASGTYVKDKTISVDWSDKTTLNKTFTGDVTGASYTVDDTSGIVKFTISGGSTH